MKSNKKNNYLALLLIPVCSLCAANSYANIYVKQNQTTRGTETKDETKPTETKEGAKPTEVTEATKPTDATETTEEAKSTDATETQEKLKISGSGKITMGYNATNHPANKPLSPALIVVESGAGGDAAGADGGDAAAGTGGTPPSAEAPKAPKDPFFTAPSGVLNLQKTILWEGEPVKLKVGIPIGGSKPSIFAEYKSLGLGFKASNFGDSDLGPSCIGGGPNSDVGTKALQLRWNLKQFITPEFSLVLSFEQAPDFKISEKYEDKLKKEQEKLKGMQTQQAAKNGEDAEDADTTQEDPKLQTCKNQIADYNSRLSYKPFGHQPALAMSLRYKHPSSRVHGYLGLLGRFIQYQGLSSESPRWLPPLAAGICLGAKAEVWPEIMTIKAQAVVGRGIGGYIGDLSSLEKEDNTGYVVPATNQQSEGNTEEGTSGATADTLAKLRILNAGGGYLAVEHCWDSEKIFRLTVVLSGLWIFSSPGRDQECYQAGLYGSISLSYHPTKEFSIGVEGACGQKVCVSGNKGTACGVRMVASFKF